MKKPIHSYLLIYIMIASAFYGCNSSNKNTASSSIRHDTIKHVYSCLVHPQITQSQPGTCSVCGRPLVHIDKPNGNAKYILIFEKNDSLLKAGEPLKLLLRPSAPGAKDGLTPLNSVIDEDDIHFFIVSKDLSHFSHTDATITNEGDYEINYTFPFAGDYTIYRDFAPNSSSHDYGSIDIHIKGSAHASIPILQTSNTWHGGIYKLTIDRKDVPVNIKTILTVNIFEDGKPIKDLEEGSAPRLIIISKDNDTFLHIHPIESSLPASSQSFETVFHKAGFYKVFFEFYHKEKNITGYFILKAG